MTLAPWHRVARQIATAAAAVVLLLGFGQSSAMATVTNVAPLNGAQEPMAGDTIFDNEEVWAYVTSPSGGVVCIHRETENPASCEAETDAYAKTPVLPFFAGIIPIQAGKLRSGSYVLVGAEAPGEPVTAVSAPFYVQPCVGACPPASLTKSAGFAQAANQMLASLNATCGLIQAASMLWRTKAVYTYAQVAIGGLGGGLGVGAVMTLAVGGAAAVHEVANGDDLTAKLPGKLGAIADGICKAAEVADKVKETSFGYYAARIAADPPDPSFGIVSPPQFTDYASIAGMPNYGFNAQRSDLDHIRGYAGATLRALERYQGADAANSAVGEHMQARALGENALGYANTLRRGAKTIDSAAAQMLSEFPDDADRTVTQFDIDAANTYVDRVRTSGYTGAEIDQLRALGLNDDMINRVRVDETIYDPGDAVAGTKMDEAFSGLAQGMRDMAVEAESMANDAWTVAGRTNVLPQASFNEGEHTGPAGLTVAFTDTSNNPDHDPLTVTWDFGDGTSTTSAGGATVQHTYANDSTRTVSMSVSDEYSSDSVSRQIAPGLPNTAPIASFTVAPADGPAPLQIHVDASASSDPGGSIASYAWEFGGSGTATGVTADHTFPDPSLAAYTVTLVVTDNKGLQSVATQPVTVRFPPKSPLPAADEFSAAPIGVHDVLSNDLDENLDPISVVGTSNPAHGTVTCTALGACTYTAEPGYVGVDTFTYTVRDPSGREGTATVTVNVGVPPLAGEPIAHADEASTRRETAVTVNVLTNDTGTPPLLLESSTQPAHGTAVCQPNGACTYTPAAGYSGSDGFRYVVANDNDQRSTGEVHLTVAPANAAFGATVTGSPDPLTSGQRAAWGTGAPPVPAGAGDDALAGVPMPTLSAALSGAHVLAPESVRTAPGWTLDPIPAGQRTISAKAGPGALLGEADTQLLAKPLPPTSQGTGGDGYVPIPVGTRVYAFFHHLVPTKVTCIDRLTGARCAGYPIEVNMGTVGAPGRAAVVGTRIYQQLLAASSFAQTASLGLYCWETATAQPCGYVAVARVPSTSPPEVSSPVLVNGKLYFAGPDAKLYCADPATNTACSQPALATGLDPSLGGGGDGRQYDIAAHGTRVYVSRIEDKAACLDVATGTTCPGWTLPKALPATGHNVFNHFDPGGNATGVCIGSQPEALCYADSNPAVAVPIAWPGPVSGYEQQTEAETGTRTLTAGGTGVYCWDWVSRAPCVGGDYGQGGTLTQDVNDVGLPQAYGVAYDGSCVLGLGDPGLLFSVDPKGTAPCSSLGSTRTLDLRDQRCDGGVGAARWTQASLQDSSAAELTSVVLTVRDAATGAVLATKDIATGPLDLSGIDAAAHPAITVVATATSAPGDAAWADAIPPRIRVAWQGDPKQLCFETTTAPACPADPISVAVGTASKALIVKPIGCPVPPVPTPVPTPVPDTKVLGGGDLLLACSDRRVVLEDVFVAGQKVKLLGVADRSLAGQKVQLLFIGKPVASTTIGADGHFETSAPLPAKKLRASPKARYQAKVGNVISLNLKLFRRMIVSSVKSAGGKVTISGRVVGPLAAKPKDRRITLQRVVACTKTESVTTFLPRANGTFSVTVPAPAGQRAAVYRMLTKVRATAKTRTLTTTFTLPRAVDFR